MQLAVCRKFEFAFIGKLAATLTTLINNLDNGNNATNDNIYYVIIFWTFMFATK